MVTFVGQDNAAFIAVAHRGAPRVLPPNTLGSFQKAQALGCVMAECDIRRSRDGVLVLAHDHEVVDRNGQRYILHEHDAATLHALDLGASEGVLTLAALIDWAAGSGMSVMPDMKEEGDGIEAEVARLLGSLPPTQKLIVGASDDARARFRALDPALPLSLTVGPNQLGEERFAGIIGDPRSLNIDAVTFVWPLLARERIDALHAAGLTVFAWTVDEAGLVERLARWGVDGIISNEAQMIAELAAKPASSAQ